MTTIPLSLYIHIPWCVRKCPYCDFNSHRQPDTIPEAEYISRLIQDLDDSLADIWGRRLISIFIGGGTPSLFRPESFDTLLSAIRARIGFAGDIEITLEANPGTVDESRFHGFRQAGINRLSLGVQSFDDRYLAKLGRIHDGDQAKRAIDCARQAGFDNINLDLMHGLPGQSVADALQDLNCALSLQPQHLSWYQLTIEPNTTFYKSQPPLPNEDWIHDMQETGWHLLEQQGFDHYEISAFAQAGRPSHHNLNYWQFGDYLGIGAGAHSKISDPSTQTISRYTKSKQPKDYLDPSKPFKKQRQSIEAGARPFEFMLNALRLRRPIPLALFEQHTFLNRSILQPFGQTEKARLLLQWREHELSLTPLGQRFTNEAMALFLTD